jgi:hypothetical protein
LPRYDSQRGPSGQPKNVEPRPMKLRAIGIRKFLRVSSALIILGLLVEIVSLLWFHPLSFVLFAFVGATLIGLGILVYLASLVFAASAPNENRG